MKDRKNSWIVVGMAKVLGIVFLMQDRRTIFYKAVLVSVSRSGVVTVMSLVVMVGPERKQEGTSLALTSTMLVNTLAASTEVYSMHRNLGSSRCG